MLCSQRVVSSAAVSVRQSFGRQPPAPPVDAKLLRLRRRPATVIAAAAAAAAAAGSPTGADLSERAVHGRVFHQLASDFSSPILSETSRSDRMVRRRLVHRATGTCRE